MTPESQHPLVRQLSLCGCLAERKARMLRQHHEEEAAVFAALDPEEQAQLAGLLSKLQARWLEDHRAHHRKE